MVIILRGTSGSGKSHLAEIIQRGGSETTLNRGTPSSSYCVELYMAAFRAKKPVNVVSSDYFHMVNGEYKFDKKNLTTAHQACLREFVKLVPDNQSIIVVDNTNCSIAETVVYTSLASAFAHEIQIVTLLTDPMVAWRRNKHEVPFSTIAKQAYELQASIGNWPSWMPQQQIFPE